MLTLKAGDTVTAEIACKNGTRRFTRTITRTVDREPWFMGADRIVLPTGEGVDIVIASTVKLVLA